MEHPAENDDHFKSTTVPRQDSGVPEDVNSPTSDSKTLNEEDADSKYFFARVDVKFYFN